jgi:hypothetical protein
MLSEWLVPHKHTVVLKLDGTPPHFGWHVRDYLNETCPGRWTGRGSEASPAPFAWPARSPDLTTPDNALWRFIKERASKMRYRTTEVLRAASLTWPRIICAKHLPEHGETLNHNRYSVENKGGIGPLLGHPLYCNTNIKRGPADFFQHFFVYFNHFSGKLCFFISNNFSFLFFVSILKLYLYTIRLLGAGLA